MKNKVERFSPERGFVESSEKDVKKRVLRGGRESVPVSYYDSAEMCRQRENHQRQQNMFSSVGHAGVGSGLIGQNEVSAKGTVVGQEHGSSSASFLRYIPLQQLRALARAAEGHCSTGVPHSRSHTVNESSSSSAASGWDRCTSAWGKGERRKQLLGRPAGHQKSENPRNRLQRERLGSKTTAAKKSCKKKLPAEVSSRRPHYATGQPLVCNSILPARCVDDLPLLPRGVRHTNRKTDDVCSSATCSSGVGSSKSSRKATARNFQGDAEFCVRKGELGGRVRLSESNLSWIGEEDAEEQGSPASNTGLAEPPRSPEATYTSERDAHTVAAQHQMAAEKPLQVRSMTPHSERTTEKRLFGTQGERDAALQRRLKSLRSLRMRLAGEGKRAATAHALRIGREVRDPRFSEACGPLDLRMVGKAYAFLDKMRKQEAEQLQRLLRKSGRAKQLAVSAAAGTASKGGGRAGATLCRAEAETEAAQKALQRFRSQEEARKRKGVELVVKGQLAREEKARIAQTGKKPFFVSRNEVNRLIQAEWRKRRHGGNACGQRRAAKQEEKKARNKVAKERRLSLVPVRRFVEKAAV